MSLQEMRREAAFFCLELDDGTITVDASNVSVTRNALLDSDEAAAKDFAAEESKQKAVYFTYACLGAAIQKIKEENAKNPAQRSYNIRHMELPEHIQAINPGWAACRELWERLATAQGFRSPAGKDFTIEF
eukprot:UN4081